MTFVIAVLDNVRGRGSKSNSHVHHAGNVLLAVQQARGTESVRVRGLYARGLGATGALASFGMDVQGEMSYTKLWS